MKRIIGLFLFCLIFQLFSCHNAEKKSEKPYLLQIKVKETDCLKCMNAYLLLKDFADVSEIKVVFNGLGEKEINRFLDINSLSYLKEFPDCNIVSDKNLYAEMSSNNAFSEAYLYNHQGELLEHFNFRISEQTMNHLKTMIKCGKYMMQESETVKLDTEYKNSSVTFSSRDDKFLLSNPPMNLVQLFDRNGHLLYEVDGANLDPADIFKEMQVTDSAQMTAMNYLKNNGMLQIMLANAFVDDEVIFVGYDVPYVGRDGTQFRLQSYYELLSYDTEDSSHSFKIICNGKEEKVSELIFDNEDDGISAIKVGYDENTATSFLSFEEYSLSDEALSVVRSKEINYPEFERQENYSYTPKLKCGLLNLQGTDFLYDVKSDSVINLPFHCNVKVNRQGDYNIQVTNDAFLFDWYSDGNEIGIIYKDKASGKLFHNLMSMKGEILDSIELPTEESDIKYYYMTSPKTALCLTNENMVRKCVF